MADITPHECDFCRQIVLGHRDEADEDTQLSATAERYVDAMVARSVKIGWKLSSVDHRSRLKARLKARGIVITDFTIDNIPTAAASGCALYAKIEKETIDAVSGNLKSM
jgi:hypothetical protein